LGLYPNRFNSLWGAARAETAVNDAESAQRFYRELVTLAENGNRQSVIQQAKKFVNSKQ
jgi:hypothetical protein